MPSVRTSLDLTYGEENGDTLGMMAVGPESSHPRSLKTWIEINSSFLETNSLLEGMVLIDIARQQGLGPGELTELWSRVHGIASRTAELRKQKMFATLRTLSQHPLVEELRALLALPAPSHSIRDARLEVSESPQARAARRAKSEAGRLLAEFKAETGIADLRSEDAERWAEQDYDEIESLRRIATLITSPFRVAEAQELKDEILSSMDPEDAEYLVESGHDWAKDLGVREFEDELRNLEECPDDENTDDCPSGLTLDE